MTGVEAHATARSRQAGVAILIGGDVVIVVGSFLTWVVSGEARRDSFATVRVAQHVGVVGMPVWETVLSVWFLTPLLAAMVLAGVAFERPVVVTVAATLLGLLALGVSALVLLAPIEHGIGPLVVLIGSIGLLVGALLQRRGRGAPAPASAEGGNDR
jgi:hypothetical protein